MSESVIERHEEIATFAFGVAGVTAIVALTGLLMYKRTAVLKFIKILLFLLALATGAIMVVTAHLGGQVRHTEIRSNFITQADLK